MSRLSIVTPSQGEKVMQTLYREMENRIAASPPDVCPVDMALAFLRLCHAQTCGKCVPCRIGLGQLTILIEKILVRIIIGTLNITVRFIQIANRVDLV